METFDSLNAEVVDVSWRNTNSQDLPDLARLGIETGLCSQFVREHLQSSDVPRAFLK